MRAMNCFFFEESEAEHKGTLVILSFLPSFCRMDAMHSISAHTTVNERFENVENWCQI